MDIGQATVDRREDKLSLSSETLALARSVATEAAAAGNELPLVVETSATQCPGCADPASDHEVATCLKSR